MVENSRKSGDFIGSEILRNTIEIYVGCKNSRKWKLNLVRDRQPKQIEYEQGNTVNNRSNKR